jgi:hypothetical protein
MQKSQINIKPNIKKRVFWDVNYEDLDFERDKFYVIEKVMNYGVWSDFLELIKFYGKDIIKKEIVKTSFLKKDVLSFVCVYFDLKPSQFKCYNRRQSSNQLWNSNI